MKPQISVHADELNLVDTSLFGGVDHERARLFARRVLGLPEIHTLCIEPEKASARIGYRTQPGSKRLFLARLAEAIGSDADAVPETELPEWVAGADFRCVRHENRLSLLQVDRPKTGLMIFRHGRLASNRAPLVLSLVGVLRAMAGIRKVDVSEEGRLAVHFSPYRAKPERIIRSVEQVLCSGGEGDGILHPDKIPMGVSSTTVGISTVGELLLPVATPVAAGILVATNIGIVKDAAVQLSQGKVGVPLFHTALLTCSIVTGQVLAFALTDWSLRYWQRRGRAQLMNQADALVRSTLPASGMFHRIESDGQLMEVSIESLRCGDHVRILEGGMVPADGTVLAGEALVDESQVSGARVPIRKSPGDLIKASSYVLAGSLDSSVEQLGNSTRAGEISKAISRTATAITVDPLVHRKVEGMGDETALPVLATAGIGWVAGDLITVGAILHQDWVSGPALVVPQVTLTHVRSALNQGVVVLKPAALYRLSECDFVVLDGDDPDLAQAELELSEIKSGISDHDTLLKHVAGAGLYLGGELTLALVAACEKRGLVVKQPELLSLEPGGVVVRIGEHGMHITAHETSAGRMIKVEIDGSDVGQFIFSTAARPAVVRMIDQLKGMGLPVFLLSSKSEERVQSLAESLGLPLYGSELDTSGKIRFMDGLSRRGVKALYTGRLADEPEIARHVHCSVTVDPMDKVATQADMLLLGGRYGGLCELIEGARRCGPDINQGTRMANIPNFLCVAGAFGGVLNGITSGIIANLGVLNVDRQLRRKVVTIEDPNPRSLIRLLR